MQRYVVLHFNFFRICVAIAIIVLGGIERHGTVSILIKFIMLLVFVKLAIILNIRKRGLGASRLKMMREVLLRN